MNTDFLHNDPYFKDHIELTAAAESIKSAGLVEKDYWLMHALWCELAVASQKISIIRLS